MTFGYQDRESLYKTWKRFKELLRKCPHHGFPLWILMQTFYNAMPSTIRGNIDVITGGALMNKNLEESLEFIELMPNNIINGIWSMRLRKSKLGFMNWRL